MLIININSILAEPKLKDPSLLVDIVVDDLSSPTGIAFVGNDILVIEKDGAVRLISNNTLKEDPLLNLKVDTISERGLLGIDYDNNSNNVYLYLTESSQEDVSLRNSIYKYSWNGNDLLNQQLILDLPAIPGPNHDGGKIIIKQQDKSSSILYSVIGDLNHEGILQNIASGDKPDGTGVVYRLNSLDGAPLSDNPFYSDPASSKYFAYGIRNSFGIAIDPVTGILWQTENGPDAYDEINIINPGFNGGWKQIMGPISRTDKTEEDLQLFQGSYYSDPLLSWKNPVALTDIEFFNSSKFGPQYTKELFVGDSNEGNLYYFQLNQERNGILLDKFGDGMLDKVIDTDEELESVVFGAGFGGITDIETGSDGFLYVLSYDDGTLYKIHS